MATETTQAASACVDAHGSAIGMPQLCVDFMPNQIFWLVVALIAIFFVLSRIALPRISAILAERQGTITNDLAAAEDLKQKAIAAENAYNDALASAKAEAGKIVAEARSAIQKQLDTAIAKADAQIAEKAAESETRIRTIREGALDAVTEVAKSAAADIVASFGGTADAKAVSAAVAARVKG